MAGLLTASIAALLLLAQDGPTPVRSAPARPDWRLKVDARLLAAAADEDQDLLIELGDRPDVSGARALTTRAEKGRFVYGRLVEAAARSQAPLMEWLETNGVEHQAFWIANVVRVRGRAPVLEALARRADVARIEPNLRVPSRLPRPVPGRAEALRAPASPLATEAVEPNLALVGAPDVWAAGVTGQGIVVAGADTGYDYEHEALLPRYRGWNGTTASHDYNWHDSVHDADAGNPCGSDSPSPCDDDGHGTSTMGIAVGDDGGANRVGMAPGARWIGCRNMDQGAGTPARYIECFQWFLAPTRVDGTVPRTDLAPDVITNSWDCPPSEGCTSPDVLRTVIENVRAAGIVVVVSAGNEGPDCGTIGVPGIYAELLTAGSVDPSDDLADYSSRGPGEASAVKPDVVAPGDDIRTSKKAGGYGSFTGTSAAAPHVAGEVALILSAAPNLTGDVDSIETIVRGTAVAKTGPETCGALPAGSLPNDSSGFGRIDALAAYEAVVCPPPAPVIQVSDSVPAHTAGLTASTLARPSHLYTWTVQGGTLGSGQGQSAVTFTSGAAGTTMSLSAIDSFGGCQSANGVAKLQVDFSDVPPSHLFHDPIVSVALQGITTGCGGGAFCPDVAVTRAQMAVFVLRAVHAPGYKPPAATGTIFGDVPLGAFLGDWIEEFAAEGFTTGCGNGNYCPDDPVNRAGAAVFLLRGKHSTAYTPPAATGTVFGDVPLGTFLGSWIEELGHEGITSGCGGGNFCPDGTLTRGEMAAFLKRTFGLS